MTGRAAVFFMVVDATPKSVRWCYLLRCRVSVSDSVRRLGVPRFNYLCSISVPCVPLHTPLRSLLFSPPSSSLLYIYFFLRMHMYHFDFFA